MYKCPKCSKVYKNNGKWMLKHMIEVCHVKSLTPIELVPKQEIDLTTIMTRISHLESMIKNGKFIPETNIKKIKSVQIETDSSINQYKNAFKDCISELKEVLGLRRQRLEVELESLVMEAQTMMSCDTCFNNDCPTCRPDKCQICARCTDYSEYSKDGRLNKNVL